MNSYKEKQENQKVRTGKLAAVLTSMDTSESKDLCRRVLEAQSSSESALNGLYATSSSSKLVRQEQAAPFTAHQVLTAAVVLVTLGEPELTDTIPSDAHTANGNSAQLAQRWARDLKGRGPFAELVGGVLQRAAQGHLDADLKLGEASAQLKAHCDRVRVAQLTLDSIHKEAEAFVLAKTSPGDPRRAAIALKRKRPSKAENTSSKKSGGSAPLDNPEVLPVE